MKKLTETELSKFYLRPEDFKPTYRANKAKRFTIAILRMKEGGYLFINQEEWPLKSSVPDWLRRNRHNKRSLLYKVKANSRSVKGGWIVRKGSFEELKQK